MKKIPRQAANSQARAAGMAKATAGRSRVFESKKGAPQKDDEISEGLQEYKERQYVVRLGAVVTLQFPKGTKWPTGDELETVLAENLVKVLSNTADIKDAIDDVQRI